MKRASERYNVYVHKGLQHLTLPAIMRRDHHSGAQMSLNERYDTIMKVIVSS